MSRDSKSRAARRAGSIPAPGTTSQWSKPFNINDDTALLMGDYFDMAADLFGLPRPPRLSRAVAEQQISALRLSFMSESRRMNNDRMKRELRLRLRFPTVREGLSSVARQG